MPENGRHHQGRGVRSNKTYKGQPLNINFKGVQAVEFAASQPGFATASFATLKRREPLEEGFKEFRYVPF